MVAQSAFEAAAVGGGSRIWDRDMEQYAAVMHDMLEDEPHARVFIRQTGHSLSPGLQVADEAATEGAAGSGQPARAWGRFEGGWRILVAGQEGAGRLRARLQKAVDARLLDNLRTNERAGGACRRTYCQNPQRSPTGG